MWRGGHRLDSCSEQCRLYLLGRFRSGFIKRWWCLFILLDKSTVYVDSLTRVLLSSYLMLNPRLDLAHRLPLRSFRHSDACGAVRITVLQQPLPAQAFPQTFAGKRLGSLGCCF